MEWRLRPGNLTLRFPYRSAIVTIIFGPPLPAIDPLPGALCAKIAVGTPSLSVEVQPAAVITSASAGCVAVDLNDKHIAVAVIDRCGNPVAKRTIPMDLRGMPADKRLSLVRQSV